MVFDRVKKVTASYTHLFDMRLVSYAQYKLIKNSGISLSFMPNRPCARYQN